MEEAEEVGRVAAALVKQEKENFQSAVEKLVRPLASKAVVKVMAAKVVAVDSKRKQSPIKLVVKKLHKVAVVMPQREHFYHGEEKVAAGTVDNKENNTLTPVDSKETNASASLKEPTECLRFILDQYPDDSDFE